MALSNIFLEPRREITETLVGITAVIGPVYLDYLFASWLKVASSSPNAPNPHGLPIPLGMVIGFAATLIICVAFIFIHYVGEEICDFLARRGLHLRPTQRR